MKKSLFWHSDAVKKPYLCGRKIQEKQTMMKLIGRIAERQLLQQYVASDKAEFIAVYGRRRVGKTFLIREMFADHFAF